MLEIEEKSNREVNKRSQIKQMPVHPGQCEMLNAEKDIMSNMEC